MRYCINPFTRLEVKSDGSVYCCCEGWLPRSLGNVLESPILEIWNGDAAREIRSAVLDGSYRYCTACAHLPQPPDHERGRSWFVANPPQVGRVVILKLDYDPTCNLACPSCRTERSAGSPLARRIHEKVLRSGILDQIQTLYLTGCGDPFASDLYWDLIRNQHEYHDNPGLRIYLHTNGLLLDAERWEEMGEDTRSRVSDVAISVDAATSATYARVRGGSWDKLWRNIRHLGTVGSEPERRCPLRLGLLFTLQECNFRELPDFVRMAWNHGTSWVSVIAMRDWGTFTKVEYAARAVHDPRHPSHMEFRSVVTSPVVGGDPRVVLDNFSIRAGS